MKILLTGATGFIGRELAKKLDQQGHEIAILTRDPDSARFHMPVHCELYKWNPDNNIFPRKALAGVEAVINLAGENIADGRWSKTRKARIMESRVKSVRLLTEAMEKIDKRPRAFVSASAIGFYGDRGDEPLDESSSKGGGFLSNVCRSWENEALKAEKLNIRTVVCRVGMVLGRDGGALDKMSPPFRLGLGGRLGNGRQWMSWIHISDLANLIIHALENPSMKGIYNAVSPNPASNKQFTKTLANVLKRPAPFPVPEFVLKMGLGDLSELLLGSQKVSADNIIASGFRFGYPDLQQALEEVCSHDCHEIVMSQWVPQPLDKTFEFFKEAKNLEKLTPDFLEFKVLKQSTQSIQEGTTLDYRLKLHGIPIGWRSKITDWEPNEKFSDIQLKGPYGYWRHTHEFENKNGGTLIRDRISYKPPFGAAGDLLAGYFIKKDLKAIFNYRCKTIDSIFSRS